MSTVPLEIEKAGGSGPGDSVRTLALFGFEDFTDLSNVRPFRMSTLQEMIVARVSLMRISGMRYKDFAENPWGFPFMPIPRSVARSEVKCLVPDSVNNTWFGHPVYWIDPDITKPTEEERQDPARWAVRMFYVIMALQLWDTESPTMEWFDALAAKGIRPTVDDIVSYRRGVPSDLDDVRWTTRDMVVPYEEVEASTRRTLERCGNQQRTQWAQFRTEQLAAYQDGLELLEDSTAWDERLTAIQEFRRELVTRIEQHEVRSDLVSVGMSEVTKVTKIIGKMDRIALTLDSVAYRTSVPDQVTFARIATVMSSYTNRVVEGGYLDELTTMVSDLVLERDQYAKPTEFAELEVRIEQIHLEALQRVEVAVTNFVRMSQGLPPFSSWAEMKMSGYMDDSDSEGDQLPSAEEMQRRLEQSDL